MCVVKTVIPVVRVNRDTVYQAVGYRIELQCFAEGNPTPLEGESYWTFAGVPLPSASDEYVSVRFFCLFLSFICGVCLLYIYCYLIFSVENPLGTTHSMSSTAFCPNLKMSVITYGNTHTISHYLLMSTLSWNKTLYIECYSRTFIDLVFLCHFMCFFYCVFFLFYVVLCCVHLSHSIKEPAAAADVMWVADMLGVLLVLTLDVSALWHHWTKTEADAEQKSNK